MILSGSFADMHRVVKNLSHRSACTSPAEVKRGDALCFLVSAPTVNKCPVRGLFSATYKKNYLVLFLLVILLFKNDP